MSLKGGSSWKVRRALAGVALVAAAGAIGSVGCVSSEETDGSGPLSSVNGFCDALAAAQCSGEIVDACVQGDEDECLTNRSKSSVCNPKGLNYNASAAKGCIDANSKAYSDGTLTLSEMDSIESACTGVLYGDGEKGADCEDDSDCNTKDGFGCVLKGAETVGSCQEPNEVGGGEDCGNASAKCDEGFYCSTTTDACLKLPGVGADCGADIPCAEGLTCTGQTDGVCNNKLSDGDNCLSDADCSSGICTKAKGASGGVCTADIRYETTSEHCEDFS